jgi:hypothetical protein
MPTGSVCPSDRHVRRQTPARGVAGRFRQLGLDDHELARAPNLVVAELSGGRAVTRAELYAAFDRAGLAREGQHGIRLLGGSRTSCCPAWGRSAGANRRCARPTATAAGQHWAASLAM